MQQQPSNKRGAWLAGATIAGIIMVVAAVSSPGSKPPIEDARTNSNLAEIPEVPVLAPSQVKLPAVNSGSVARAARHLKLALDAEGFAGAMVYSQNCFASLATTFSWGKLDQCEGFDSLATVALSQSFEQGPEADYFQENASHARFTAAALQHQGEPSSVESHLSDLARAAFAKIENLATAEGPPDISYGASDDATSSADEEDDAPSDAADEPEQEADPELNNPS